MTDTENGGAASSPELAELTRAVRALTERVHELEQRLPPRAEPAGQVPPATPVSPVSPVARGTAPAPLPVLGSEPARPASPAHERASGMGKAPPASWRVGPLRRVEREHLPVILMGAAGGVALLMGTLYFAWYSIQQGWISPEVRVGVTALFGLCAMAAAWRLAPRGQTTVAASLGGAGLGAWFGAVLVARHSHAFISPATTFALLAVGAALGMAIATHRRLRLFATLAAFAALITPLSIDYYADRLHERMTYQLVVVVFLHAIEHRRRWVELGYIAVLGTWFLLLAWLSEHSGEQASVDVVGWAFAYLVLGHAQSWRLVRAGRITDLLATPRWWLNAYAAWFIGGIGARGDGVAYTALGMAVLNGLAARALLAVPRASAAPAPGGMGAGTMRSGAMRLLRSPLWRRASLSACLSVAWLQLFAFAPLRWETNLVLIWWSAMAVIVTVQHIRTRSYSYLIAFLLPVFAAVVWSVEHPETISKVLGFAVASLPLWIAAWPTRDSLERAPWTFDAYLAGQLVLGAGLWAIVSLADSEDRVPPGGWFVLLCLAAALPVSLRLVAQPSNLRCHNGLACLGALVVTSISISADVGLLEVRDGFGTERLWQIAVLVGVAALALHYGVRFKALADAPASPRWIGRVHDYAGVILAGALLVVAMLLVSGWVPALGTDPANADSINQAGWSVCWAIAGLVLLLRGLLTRCVTWRRAGMLVLFATGTKLVAVDLVHVSMLWRVLSFAGLGACLLLGAYAYRRIGIWAEAEGPPS